MRTLLVLVACFSAAGAAYSRYTLDVPAQSMLVHNGGREMTDVVAIFPQAIRLFPWDRRLKSSEVVPYWRWDFDVIRDVQKFKYSVTMSIMGTPQEGLRYQDKSRAGWRRPDLEQWASQVLHRFEAHTWATWRAYRTPPREAEEEAFKQSLMSWFRQSKYANQGIHIERIDLNLPDLSAE